MATLTAPTLQRADRRTHVGPGGSEPVCFTARAPDRVRFGTPVVGLVATAVWSLLWLGAWVAVPAVVLGWQPVAITSGSMSPLIRAGDVVLLDPDAPVEAGSVITYPRGAGLETHRVVSATRDGYVTRGDANAAPDRHLVTTEEVVGVGRLVVPLVGTPSRATGLTRSSAASWVAATSPPASNLATAHLAPATGMSATCVSSGRVDLSWTPSTTEPVTGYRLERRRKGEGTFSFLAHVPGRLSSSYTDTATPFGGLTLLGTTTTTYRLTSVRAGATWTSASVEASTTGNVAALLLFSCA